jgi:hypothetical protein
MIHGRAALPRVAAPPKQSGSQLRTRMPHRVFKRWLPGSFCLVSVFCVFCGCTLQLLFVPSSDFTDFTDKIIHRRIPEYAEQDPGIFSPRMGQDGHGYGLFTRSKRRERRRFFTAKDGNEISRQNAPAFARMLRRGKQKAQNEERTSNFGFRFSSCRVEAQRRRIGFLISDFGFDCCSDAPRSTLPAPRSALCKRAWQRRQVRNM